MRTLAIIPARGGSKGIPRKNARLLLGRPLIAHSIRSAKASALVDRIIVSTDDAEIGGIAEAEGVEVLRRPASLADDLTPMLPVVLQVLEHCGAGNGAFDAMTLLQPTSPFRRAEDIDASIRLLDGADGDGVFGVYRLGHVHPSRMYRIVDGRLVALNADSAGLDRQRLEPIFQRNGAIYTLRCAAVREQRTLLVRSALPYEMSVERSINLDEPFDWIVAEAVGRALLS